MGKKLHLPSTWLIHRASFVPAICKSSHPQTEVGKRKPHPDPFGTTHAAPAATVVAVRRICPGQRLELADVFDPKLFLCLGPKEYHSILAAIAANTTHKATEAAGAQVDPPRQIPPQFVLH
jgi:hypothetical protein